MQSSGRPPGRFPAVRMRRNRRWDWSRRLVAESTLSASDLIWPAFIHEGSGHRVAIPSMPGVDRLSIDLLLEEVQRAKDLGIPAVALFPATEPDKKTADGEEATRGDNLICRAVRAIKEAHQESIGVVCDVALDPYTTHGQDGLVREGYVVNDENAGCAAPTSGRASSSRLRRDRSFRHDGWPGRGHS